ncbi:MAG: lysophospholipid acyltransferase family protein [Candidatus Thermoplasmatota archaeon]|nr:lysophospholipid acyltransferase family protein [Candidatus Thermoplasmatota archaeon]
MQYTVFDTPVLKPLFKLLSRLFLKFMGWKVVDRFERPDKFFAIAAPHTSNWDFPMFLSIAFVLDLNAYWMGKHTLFRKPFGPLFKWLGGLPIDRSKKGDTVQQCIGYFRDNDRIILANAPEGTRKRVDNWKSGFYHIAVGAGVPIAFTFLDYGKKEGGIGGHLNPSGDYESDMKKIMGFYSTIRGKHPENFAT